MDRPFEFARAEFLARASFEQQLAGRRGNLDFSTRVSRASRPPWTKAGELTRALNADIVVGAIGPVCAHALRQLGVTPDVMPAASNTASLITAVADYFDLIGTTE
jgi:hypothetical protein